MRAKRRFRSRATGSRNEASVRPHAARRQSEDGFSLIELLIVLVILPIVVGGIAAALIGILQNETTTFNRVADSTDAQITSENFVRDVQNSSLLSTGGQCLNTTVTPSYPPAGSTPLLGLQWSDTDFRVVSDGTIAANNWLTSSTADFTPADSGAEVSGNGIAGGTTISQWNSNSHPPDTSTMVWLSQPTRGSESADTVTISLMSNWEVNYWDVPDGSGPTATYQLVRMFCSVQGTIPTFSSQAIVAHDLPVNQGPATITCGPTIQASKCTPNYLSTHWVPTAGIADVSLSAAEPGSGYQFNLSATPRSSNPTSEGTTSGGSASALLLTGPGPSNLNVPGTTDTLTVNGELAFNSTSGSLAGGGKVVATPGPIAAFNCTTCAHVTANAQFTGTCACAAPGSLDAQIPNPDVPVPTAVSGPTESCSGANVTCQPGFYPNPVTVSGNVTFTSGNYTFADPVVVTDSGSSVTFGMGQYTFNEGLTVNPEIGITGNGVLFYFAGTTGSLNIGGGGAVNLAPTTSGPYIGVLIYQPVSNSTQMFLGAAGPPTANAFGGAVEAPGALVTLGSTGDTFSVGALVAANVSLGPSNVTVTVGP